MPELADVEGFRRVLAGAGRRRIRDVEVRDAGVLRNVTPAGLAGELRGRRLGTPERRGKWLRARTDGPSVLFHFGMSGALELAPWDGARHPHDRVVLALDRGELRYRDQRKLRGVWLARDEAEERRAVGDVGIDATALDLAALRSLLGSGRASIKALLMDQSRVAGLGNLMVDEILWNARIHPARPAGGLEEGAVRRLHRALRSELRVGIRAGRVPGGDRRLTGRRDTPGARCPRCRERLDAARIAGWRSVFCPRCQPRG